MFQLDPYNLLGGLVFGTIGWGVFIYAKRLDLPKMMGSGVVLMVYPYFIKNPWLMWGCGVGLLFMSWRFRHD